MSFCHQVPKYATLIVKTGMDDFAEYENERSHDDAVRDANQWNIGKYHPDVWMTVFYRRHGLLYECLWLTEGTGYGGVIGFIYGHEVWEIS